LLVRVLLVTYDSRGGVEPLAGLAVQLRALGAEVSVCAPPDEEFAERLATFGVPLVPFGDPVRALATGAAVPSEADMRRHMDEVIAAQFDTVATAAEGCDALVAAGLVPLAAGVRSVAEKLGVHYVYVGYHPGQLPSSFHRPPTFMHFPLPPALTDNRMLWDKDAVLVHEIFGATLNSHRAAIGLAPVDNVRDYAFTEHPWLAADPTLGPWPESADPSVVQTGAWLVPDERPLSADLLAFLDAGTPPVYVGFGSMPLRTSGDVPRMAIEAIREQGRRVIVSRGWAELALIDDRDDCIAIGEVNQQVLFGRVAAVVHHGGAGTTTTAALAGAPQVVLCQGADQLYWAARVCELGIGVAYDGQTTIAEFLPPALALALRPETRAQAGVVAAGMRPDGAAVAARLLLDAVGSSAASR